MKRILALILALTLCATLAACGGSAGGALPNTPDNWDRLAEATATMNSYYNCTTIEEMKQIMEKGTSQQYLEDWYAAYGEYAAMGGEPVVTQVRSIRFVETYKGMDVFLVTAYTLMEGEEFPEEELPQVGDSADGQLHPMMMMLGYGGQMVGMVIQDGRYVISSDYRTLRHYEVCMSCSDGLTVQEGTTPCVSCDGTGLAPECTTCGGMGVLMEVEESEEEEQPQDVEITDDELAFSGSFLITAGSRKDCPDCISGYEQYFEDLEAGKTPSPIMVQEFGMNWCPDCGGIGCTGSVYIACPECDGQGYKIR